MTDSDYQQQVLQLFAAAKITARHPLVSRDLLAEAFVLGFSLAVQHPATIPADGPKHAFEVGYLMGRLANLPGGAL